MRLRLRPSDSEFFWWERDPLYSHLTQTVTYVITSSTPALSGPYFVFQNVGNIFAGGFASGSGTITYSINSGPNQALTALGNNLTPSVNDLTIVGTQTGATVNNIVRLNAGTFTTSGNVAAAPPSNGSFNTFIIDNNGMQHSGFGVAVPEPKSAMLLLSGGLGLLFLMRSARRSR